ncbi:MULTISPECIES: DUF6783 domain-containing protein [Lachnospiraceae]|uniref:DUF6783 domain-containing protein n=1 Tax=Lachnospiraceae TaxID=186803 RepID=UPI003A43EC08
MPTKCDAHLAESLFQTRADEKKILLMKFSYRIWLLTGALSNIFEKYKSLFKYVVRKILTKDLFFASCVPSIPWI